MERQDLLQILKETYEANGWEMPTGKATGSPDHVSIAVDAMEEAIKRSSETCSQ